MIQEDPPWPDFNIPPRWEDYLDALLDWMKRWRIVQGTGMQITDAPGKGKLASVDSTIADAAQAGEFKCARSGLQIRVIYGTINSIGGVTSTIVPDGMSPGDVPPYLIDPVGDSGYVCIGGVVETSPGAFQGTLVSAFIECFEDPPDNDEPTFYLAVGSYASPDGNLVVTPGGRGNGVGTLAFELCGGLGGNAQWGAV